MMIVVLVGAGGMIGAVSRYLVGGWVHDLLGDPSFPYGTLTVNILGCLLIGLLVGLAESRQVLGAETRAFLLIGLLGGFTTFSAFGLETVNLVRDGELLGAFSNVGLQVVVGLTAVWVGLGLPEWV